MKNRYTRGERRAILTLSVIAIVISVVLLLFQKKETGVAGNVAADSTGTSLPYYTKGNRHFGGRTPIPEDGSSLSTLTPPTGPRCCLSVLAVAL